MIANALSFDVEDWYQVSDFDHAVSRDQWAGMEDRIVANTTRLLDLLDERGVKATFFILTWNAERHPYLVRDIAARGHEIASHGHLHHLLYRQTREEASADIARSVAILENLTGTKILGYRAPTFSIRRDNDWALDVLLELGFAYDSSVFPIRRGLYGMPGARRFPFVIRERDGRQLTEFPLSTARLLGRNVPVSGGAYLRILPYPLLRSGLASINREGHPAVVYLHPWEIDPAQPRIDLQGKRSTHYLNLAATEGKLRQLLADFRFAPMRSVLGIEDTAAVPEE